MKLIDLLRLDLQAAETARATIEEKIIYWLELYQGEDDTEINDGRSRVTHQLIKRQVETGKAVVTASFNTSKDIVKLTGGDSSDMSEAHLDERILNYQYTQQFENPTTFIGDSVHIAMKEGTVIGKVGLRKNKITNKTYPTTEIIPNEDYYPDPTVIDINKAQFHIHRFEKTISELENSGVYYDIDKIGIEDTTIHTIGDNNLSNYRKQRQDEQGMTADRQADDEPRKRTTIYEYWGNLAIDFDDKGIPIKDDNGDILINEEIEPIPCLVAFAENIIIRCEKNPMPQQMVPFFKTEFTRDPNNFWGLAMADSLQNYQRILTALQRGFIENIAYSNNNMYAGVKGALDPVNKKLLERGKAGTYVEFNTRTIGEAVTQLAPLALPPQSFNMFEWAAGEAETTSGIGKTMSGGIDQYATATNTNISASYGEKRMLEFVNRYIENFLRPMFKMWILLNREYLPAKDVVELTGFKEFKGWTTDPQMDIRFNIALGGLDSVKSQQIVNLMGYMPPLVENGTVPPDILRTLLAKYCDMQGFQDLADIVGNYQPPQPTQEQQAMQQLGIEKSTQEVELIKAQIAETYAKAGWKQADIPIKQAKVQMAAVNADRMHERDIAKTSIDLGKHIDNNELQYALEQDKLNAKPNL